MIVVGIDSDDNRRKEAALSMTKEQYIEHTLKILLEDAKYHLTEMLSQEYDQHVDPNKPRVHSINAAMVTDRFR